MKLVNSYKCSYCDKLYESKDSCRSHENRCYFNPKTRSCASCAFLKYDNYEYKTNHSYAVRTCMKGRDVTRKQKNHCKDYFFKNAIGSAGKIEQAEKSYNPIPQVKKHLKEIGVNVENNLKVVRNTDIEIELYDNEYYSLKADALLDKLISAVGYKILFLTESELSRANDPLKDNDLDMHFNLQHDEIDNVISIFSSIGIPSETTYNLIEKISMELPKTLVYAYPLIVQSEISYNKRMAEAFEYIGDEGSAYYFKKMASMAENMEGIEKVFNDFFPNNKIDKLQKEKIPAFHENCLKKITGISPDLRNKIIAGLKNNTTVEELISDVPF
jgi:hypothetical protein